MKSICKYLIMAVIAATTVYSAKAQNHVTVTQNHYYLKGDSAFVGLQIELNDALIAKRAFVLFTPVIQDDSLSLELPAVMINGESRHKAYLRMVALGRKPVELGQVINAGEKNATSRSYLYSASVAYKPWMKEAGLTIREDRCECGGPMVKLHSDLIAKRIHDPDDEQILANLNLIASFRQPKPEPVKTRSETGTAYLEFVLGSSTLKPKFMNNAAELAKISEMIEKIKDDPAITIDRIIIDGYASPEGEQTMNNSLSEKRSTALKDYLCRTYHLDENLFSVTGHGEDWATFEKILIDSKAPYRDEVLEIIRSTNDSDAREKKLKALQGGTAYKEILSDIFAKLRRSEYELHYTVIPFNVEEGKKKLEINPSLLSLNEMFLIAESYPTGGDEFRRVFDIAVKTYPDSEIANFNAAANALTSQDLSAAKKFLAKVAEHDAFYKNNLGMLTAMQGKYDEAADHFRKAVEEGNAEAVNNLHEIENFKKKFYSVTN